MRITVHSSDPNIDDFQKDLLVGARFEAPIEFQCCMYWIHVDTASISIKHPRVCRTQMTHLLKDLTHTMVPVFYPPPTTQKKDPRGSTAVFERLFIKSI